MTGYVGPTEDKSRQSDQKQGSEHKGVVSEGFGFVTNEDRAKWDQMRKQREADKKANSFNRVGLSSGAEGMGEIMQEGLRAKLFAAQSSELQDEQATSNTEEIEAKRQRMIDEIIQPEPREDADDLDAQAEKDSEADGPGSYSR